MSRQRFLDAIRGGGQAAPVSFGTGTSIACQDLMAATGASFPEAHTNPEKMADLAQTGHTLLGFDVVMPLFSVCHEAAAMGCNVKWGSPTLMPESGRPIFKSEADIRIPPDLLVAPRLCGAPGRHRPAEAAAGRFRGGVRQGDGLLDPGLPLFRRGEFPHRHPRRSPGQRTAFSTGCCR